MVKQTERLLILKIMRATIKDIAKKCGVSTGTVDRALNNRDGVNEEVKKRVFEAAKELDYRPNYLARSLATGKTMTIGVICFDFYNNFFPALIDKIEGYAKEHGYFINLILSHAEPQKEMEGINYFTERKVDGVILFPICTGDDYVAYLKSLRIPIVTIFNKISDDFMYIGVDDVSAIENAVEYLVKKKYDDIVYVTHSVDRQYNAGKNAYFPKQRLKGFMEGIKKVGYDDRRITVLQGSAERAEFADRFERSDRRVCFLCSCDSIALDMSKLLHMRGLYSPADFGIMGYDNIDVLDYTFPRLTTIDYNIDTLAKLAFTNLLSMVETGQKSGDLLLDFKIIEGDTTP
jgi:LacI family transcriptional regulator